MTPRLLAGGFYLSGFAFLLGCGTEQPAAQPEAGEAGEAIVQSGEKGPVKLTVRLSPKRPRLSDLIEMRLEVESEAEVEISPPPFGKAVGEFLILDYREAPPRVVEGRNVRAFEYKLEPKSSGRQLIRSIGVRFTDARANSESPGAASIVETQPIELEVVSSLGEAKPDLADLVPMEAPRALAPRPWPPWVWALLAGGFGIACLAVALALKRKKEIAEAAKRLTPEEIALNELQDLMKEQLPEKGLVVDFYVRLTGTVRRYIELKTGVRAPEQTTEEFLREVRRDVRFEPERSAALGRFLESSDLVKYAAQKPEPKDIQDAFQRAQDFVGLTGGSLLRAPEPQPAAEAAEVR